MARRANLPTADPAPAGRAPVSLAPAIVVHDLADCLAALEAARDLGRSVTLLSAPGAAGSGGAPWWRCLVAAAKAREPKADFAALLDCGPAPGYVLAALRAGVTGLVFTGPPRLAVPLRAAAAKAGATLLTRRPPCRDLLDEPDRAAACRTWLAAHEARASRG